MSTIILKNINEKIKKNEGLLEILTSNSFERDLKNLEVSWTTRNINSKSRLYSSFVDFGFIDRGGTRLNSAGLLFCARISIDFEEQLTSIELLDNKYKIIETISIGKNSCTFLARHVILDTLVVLKFLRPGASENIIDSLKLIASNEPIPNLVQPQDYFKTKITDVFKRELEVECIIFPYIKGNSLKEFLSNESQPINAYAIAAFIKQVSYVLNYLEKKGAYHGDLHEENIIVTTDNSGNLRFKIIDVSFGVTGSLTSDNCKNNDLIFFRQHVWNFLSAQQKYLTKMSIRKYLGAKIFYLVNSVMLNEAKTFGEIYSLFEHNLKYDDYKKKKLDFLREKFNPPGTFKLQRYEEITDQSVALRLFVPFPELMELTKSFANFILSGSRGSGKSTYLAAIGFFPKANNSLVDFREIFGVYFPCRQGEFRLLSPEMIDYKKVGVSRVKHVIIVKIIRRTLEAIADGIESNTLTEPEDYSLIKTSLEVFLGNNKIVSLEKDIVSEIRNLVSTMIRVEMKVLDNLFNNKHEVINNIATEINILNFFRSIRESVLELSNTTFHLLFDDAGTPNIPSEVQCVINDIIISSNPIYCVKLTTEKNSYKFSSTSGKELENGQDYFESDINSIFYTGSKTFGLDDRKLESHFKRIVSERLSHFNYQSNDITKYIGDDIAKFESLVNSLAAGRRNAYYCGWSMVWKIAGGNARNLLELISEIFSVANVNEKSAPSIITNRNQDRAIRSVSEKRLRSISQISGAFEINGIQYSVGRRLFDITLAIGSVFRIYLRSERGKQRKNQYLAIERNEFEELSPEAGFILRELIKYGIFDDSRLDYARDDNVKKPIYILNRIYCPVFGISFRRDQHLRLSKGKLEQLLLAPSSFVKNGTSLLRMGNRDGTSLKNTLFEELNDE